MERTKRRLYIGIAAFVLLRTAPVLADSSEAAGGDGALIRGLGIAALELLAVFVFIALTIKRSDGESIFLRARAKERNRYRPPKARFPGVTTVASNRANEDDKNFSPFSGEIDYGEEGEAITDRPVGEVFTPFTGNEHSEIPDNGTVFDMATEKAQYVGVPKGERTVYEGEIAPLSERTLDGTVPAVNGLERDEGETYATTGNTIFTAVKEGENVPEIEAGSDFTTTAPSIFDTVNANKIKKKQGDNGNGSEV